MYTAAVPCAASATSYTITMVDKREHRNTHPFWYTLTLNKLGVVYQNGKT